MPSWLMKAAVQGTLSLLPQPEKWNYLFQRHVSKRLKLSQSYFEGKLTRARAFLDSYQQTRPGAGLPANALELGAGWLPVVPIGLAIGGIPQVYTVDKSALMRPHLLADVVDFFLAAAESGQLTEILGQTIRADHIDRLQAARSEIDSGDIHRTLATLGVTYLVTDARCLSLDDGSIDYFISNNTLEHIPGEIIRDIFIEFHRVAAPDAIMAHSIDLSDHYSHFDRSLTPYHFLRFSDATWRIFNNTLHYQSRLRVSDYRVIHEEAGFRIIEEKNKRGTPQQIKGIKLHPRFTSYNQEDLTVTSSWMTSVPV